jgi:hypothetical protein
VRVLASLGYDVPDQDLRTHWTGSRPGPAADSSSPTSETSDPDPQVGLVGGQAVVGDGRAMGRAGR